jgi:Protein of unknown function (DUF3551)
MRSVTVGTSLLVATALSAVAFVAFKPAPAKAEIFYPWCLMTDMGDGAQNCSFDSFEQCRGSLVGAGGFCMQNIWYTQQQKELQQHQAQPPVQQVRQPAPVAKKKKTAPPPPQQ